MLLEERYSYVNTENIEALSLYKKCGYLEKGNAIFMEKETFLIAA